MMSCPLMLIGGEDEGVYYEPVMNGGNSRGMDVRCTIFIFCIFHITLDVVHIYMEANWRIRDKVEKGNYVNVKWY